MTPWKLGRDTGDFVKTMAHEMGHHVYQSFLSGSDKKAWSQFIRGNYTTLDLEYAVKQLKAIGAKTIIDDKLAIEDPREGSYCLSSIGPMRGLLSGNLPKSFYSPATFPLIPLGCLHPYTQNLYPIC